MFSITFYLHIYDRSKFVFGKLYADNNSIWGRKCFKIESFMIPTYFFFFLEISIYIHLVEGDECETVIDKRLPSIKKIYYIRIKSCEGSRLEI